MESVEARLAAALERLGQAQRVLLQHAATTHGLSPIQARILGWLRRPGPERHHPSAVADEFGVSRATVADALAALGRKNLVTRLPSAGDARRVRLALTPEGRAAADSLAGWAEPLQAHLRALPDAEQGALLVTLLGLIADLQGDGTAPTTRMCLTCQFFRPEAHPGREAPHHCALMDAPLAERELRIDCPEHQQSA